MVRSALVGACVAAMASCGSVERSTSPAAVSLPSCLRAPETDPSTARLYGLIADEEGRPLAGARVEALRWGYHHGNWTFEVWSEATSNERGEYSFAGGPGHYVLRVRSGDHDAIAVRVSAGTGRVRRLDFRIDTSMAPGVVAILDARTFRASSPPDCEWRCPDVHPPADDWWLGSAPCPPDTQLRFELRDDDGHATVSCRTDADVLHGPYTAWHFSKWSDETSDVYGWYQRGERCGDWRTRDEPTPPPPFAPDPTEPGVED